MACTNTVKCMCNCASGHIVNCSEFIRGIYEDIAVLCAHVLISICGHLRDIFVVGKYMAIRYEVHLV